MIPAIPGSVNIISESVATTPGTLYIAIINTHNNAKPIAAAIRLV